MTVGAGPVRFWLARLPWLLLALTTALVVASIFLSIGHEPLSDTLLYGLIGLTMGLIGAFVASRQPGNPIGWIFCVQAVLKSQVEAWGEGFKYHHLPTAAVGTWVSDWVWILDASAYAVVFLLFPTGLLPSRRWRWNLRLLGVAGVIGIIGEETSPVMFGVGMSLFLAGTAGSIVSLIVRFRGSTGTERLQLKQLVLAACIILPTMAVSVVFYLDSLWVQSLLALAFLALPVAVGIAILRHRLYDIDVVINRALVYGSLTATLAITYLATVLVLELALSPVTSGSSVAIAVSTLAVAGLFRPARSRIQKEVDRRFFRARYDRDQILGRFGVRLRDQVNLGDIGTDLLTVVHSTVQPAHASLWLRAPETDRSG